MTTEPSPCPICRERHEPRGLSFDGKGINSCGMYRCRLATFTTASDDIAAHLGPLFAAAPDLLAALESLFEDYCSHMHDEYDFPENPWSPERDSDTAALMACAAIRKARGEA